jgi:hypothetical protein
MDLGLDAAMSGLTFYVAGAIFILALISCFFGLKSFRAWAAFLAFMITAIGISEWLQPIANKGVITIAFMIAGLVAAFLAFHCVKVSSVLFIGLLMFGVTEDVEVRILWMRVAMIVLPAALSIPVRKHALIIFTSLWGGLTLAIEGLFSLLPAVSLLDAVFIGLAIAVLGVFAQYADIIDHVLQKRRKVKCPKDAAPDPTVKIHVRSANEYS